MNKQKKKKKKRGEKKNKYIDTSNEGNYTRDNRDVATKRKPKKRY